MEFQRYRGRGDLRTLLALASAITAARAPSGATWHPGDLIWQLRGRYDLAHPLYAIVADGAAVGVVWFQGDQLLLDLLPSHEALAPDVLDWALEKAKRAAATTGAGALKITASDRDAARRDALARAGFQREGPSGVAFEHDLTDASPELAAPGFLIRDCVGIDAEARAAAHRDAWSALGHMGIDATSAFSADEYRSIAGIEGYDPRLDMVAEAPDGRLVGNCIAWVDRASGVAVFEPVGVSPEARGKRLAGAIMAEALRRLAAAGLKTARVGTAHFNTSAIAAYAQTFTLVDRSSLWTRQI